MGADSEQGKKDASDCRNEPPYPGLHTVVFAINAPNLTCHTASKRCPTEGPHTIKQCGEFTARKR